MSSQPIYGQDYAEPWDPGPEDNPTISDDPRDAELERQLAFNRDVSEQLHRLRVSRAAQDAHRLELTPPGEPFDAGLLREVLARPADPPMRVAGLIPSDAAALVVAQRKTGKTTFELNYARSLITGRPLLGRFDVRPIVGNVALLNYEVSADTLARWADEHDVPDDRLLLVNLRGRRNPLTLPEDRERLAALLRQHDVESVIVDPFGRAYGGLSQNDPGEVGAWLVDLDVFTRTEAGATDLLLTAHAGWNGERSRGSSALEDWADVIITMTRDQADETKRFIRAMGRDVELEEDELHYDPKARYLTLAGTGSRKQAREGKKSAELAVLVVRAARTRPGISYSAAEVMIRGMDDNPGFRSGEVSRAAQLAASQGLLHIGRGARGAVALTAIDPTSPTSPDLSPGTSPTSPTSPNRGEVEVEECSTPELSQLDEAS